MRVLCLLGLFLVLGGAAAQAQDTRPLKEPAFPRVCRTIKAPLRADAEGPLAGASAAQENAESARQTQLIQNALEACKKGQAVELALGTTPAYTAFLIEPITLPNGVSLIVNGGVTVFASRNPAKYQVTNSHGWVCGEVGEGWPIFGACHPLITLNSHSGVYGYGVLDGQGQRDLIRDDERPPEAWWDLLQDKKNNCISSSDVGVKQGCEQAAPPMIYAAPLPQNGLRKDLTLYKITIRDPQFHTVMVGGDGVTIWGVKVQAPWNVPNSDGFDLRGTNILVKDVTVANGDQDIVITSTRQELTTNVTVDGPTLYSKGGVALLGDGKGIAHMLVNDLAMTGGVTSFERRRNPDGRQKVLINGRDPKAMTLRGSDRHLRSHGQALPTATNEIQGIQLDYNLQKIQESPGPIFDRITFQSVCLQDVVWPIRISRENDFSTHPPGDTLPTIKHILFRDVHVLPPSEQFPRMKQGVVQEGESGVFHVGFQALPEDGFFNHVTLDNVVFDDLTDGGMSLRHLNASGTVLRTLTNVYPPVLSHLDGKSAPSRWKLSDNLYVRKSNVSDPSLAIPCPESRWSYLSGELYLSGPGSRTGSNTNLQAINVRAGGSVTLNAVLQPAMSQTTWFVPDSYNAKPGLLAIGAPALAEAVEFYEGETLIGRARLRANGTLAMTSIRKIAPGSHRYTAKYPGDAYYKPFVFGSVSVEAR